LSAPIVSGDRDGVYFEVTVCCKKTTHCFHVCIHVIVLWMYTNAINTQLKYIDWTVQLYMFQHPKVNIGGFTVKCWHCICQHIC